MAGTFQGGVLVVPSGLDVVTLTVSTAAVGPVALSFPAHNLRRTVAQASGKLRWTAAPGASTHPTATFGLKLDVDQTLVHDGDLENLRFIRDAAQGSDVTVTLHYFGL